MKKEGDGKNRVIWIIIKSVFFIVLGFLPSFLFILLFIQSGSPFSNYIEFLSDPNLSWGAWLSAGLISIFGYLIVTLVQKENFEKIFKNKFLFFTIIFLFLAILALVLTQLYLYVHYTLKNDILIRLSVDKEDIFFTNNSAQEINFKMAVTMNPFCVVNCNYQFTDLSSGQEIDQGTFNLSSVTSKSKNYEIKNEGFAPGSQSIKSFEVKCKSKKTFLCYTSEKENKRTVLITLNYDLTEEDKQFKDISKEKIILLNKNISLITTLFNETSVNLIEINNTFFTEYFYDKMENISNEIILLNLHVSGLKELWETQEFDLIREKINISENKTKTVYSEIEQISSNVLSDITSYNSLIDNMDISKQHLIDISLMNMDSDACNRFDQLVMKFNNLTTLIEKTKNLSEKMNISNKISLLISDFSFSIPSDAEVSQCLLTEPINQEVLIKIVPVVYSPQFSEILFEEQTPVCCFSGNCEKCCEDECSNKNYPIIFLHGQNINRALPADYSLDAFTLIKEKLSEEGYINAGAVILSSIEEKNSLWGRLNATMIMTASYFFDTSRTENGGEITVSSSSGNIDIYAIRLRNIINLVKARTNKDKVVIVAHSMGGVVTRRYIQIFGAGDIDKIILITVPNKGIDDKIKDYCGVIGPQESCDDLGKDSVLMNKLNNDPTEIVPTYNFIGIGCDMGAETGDGIIKNSSQYLETATDNFYFTGKCNEFSFDYFHEDLVDPELYPEVYNTLKEILSK